ncbi:MAG: polyprenyl synthetase family protein [Bacteroides sp.]|nr:polyprenyl synthetase family protein [Eubacterium sp.]MCM1418946.1 polyprenyl synthetase family protein [Roseburia sp.]MCM1462110.1 polyprenyl synthetase family protein [Bacteroides sp.]
MGKVEETAIAWIEEYREIVEGALTRFLPPETLRQGRVIRAALHSLSAGGKRLRPILTLKFCEICGGRRENALPAACAIEYVHTFSLIHDDLPCMDDDDLRRGKPSCHKAFDEATALLAGDALAVLPFGMVADSARDGLISPAAAVRIVSALSEAVGLCGMIGGQQIDTEPSDRVPAPEEILEMYSMKTGALLRAACVSGVYCAESGAREEGFLRAAADYADNLGLAFQLVDDLLDMTGDTALLGKPVGSDERAGKPTYAAVMGVERTREKAAEYTARALAALETFPESGGLRALTRSLLGRNA